MVVFGLFARKRNMSSNYTQSSPNKILNKNKRKDVIDELMDIGNDYGNNSKIQNDFNVSGLDTSSFNLRDIMNRATNKNINYKDALMNSLYAQVDFLKQELVEKNKIIQGILNINNQNPTISNIKPNTNDIGKDHMLYDTINSSECLYVNSSIHAKALYDKNIDPEFAAWEQHSNGFASRIMKKMGYRGGGLGKDGNGIINPIMIPRETCNEMGTENSNNEPSNKNVQQFRVKNTIKPWPAKTTLITGSSIINGIEEHRLRKYKAIVRPFPGACVDDLYDYITPLLKKKPTNIILQIGSNDAPNKTADQIFEEISNLKRYIEDILPSAKIFVSCPLVRLDNSHANLVLRQLDEKLKALPYIIKNDNLDVTCLGKKGLHLNPKGSGRLALNYISLMRRL